MSLDDRPSLGRGHLQGTTKERKPRSSVGGGGGSGAVEGDLGFGNQPNRGFRSVRSQRRASGPTSPEGFEASSSSISPAEAACIARLHGYSERMRFAPPRAPRPACSPAEMPLSVAQAEI